MKRFHKVDFERYVLWSERMKNESKKQVKVLNKRIKELEKQLSSEEES